MYTFNDLVEAHATVQSKEVISFERTRSSRVNMQDVSTPKVFVSCETICNCRRPSRWKRLAYWLYCYVFARNWSPLYMYTCTDIMSNSHRHKHTDTHACTPTHPHTWMYSRLHISKANRQMQWVLCEVCCENLVCLADTLWLLVTE